MEQFRSYLHCECLRRGNRERLSLSSLLIHQRPIFFVTSWGRGVQLRQVHSTSHGSPVLPSLYPSSPSSQRRDNGGTPGVDAEESVQSSFTTYIFLMSPSSKLSMFTVGESATSPVHRMNHSARLCAVPTRRQIRPRTRRRPPQSCLCRERRTPAMQSALSSETFPLCASARQCITMRQVDLHVTCSGPDTLASRHPLWTGLVGSTASSCIPSSGHANPDGLTDGAHQRTTWRPLMSVCLAVQFRPPPNATCCLDRRDFNRCVWSFDMLTYSQRFLELLRSDLTAHAPTENTDRSSASHHCKLMIHDQTN